MEFYTLASGSSGNCSLVCAGDTLLLIDAGISCRRIDKVLYQGKACFVWGRRTSGTFLLRTIDGIKVKDGVSYRNLTLLERSSNYLIA